MTDMSQPPILATAPNPPDLLVEAHIRFGSGFYEEAIALVDRMLTSQPAIQQLADCWVASALILKARGLFALERDPEAHQCLAQIPPAALANWPTHWPDIFALRGLTLRRAAYELYRRGKARQARGLANKALEFLKYGASIAYSDHQRLLKYNTELSGLYTRGLIAAIDGESKKVNPNLVKEAVRVECVIRSYSAPVNSDPATGLTIIADLARGADLGVSDTRRLDLSLEYQGYCLQLFGPGPDGWPEVLLREANRTVANRPASAGRALILGTQFLLQGRYVGRDALMDEYQLNLIDVLLRLGKPGAAETPLLKRLRDAKDRLCVVTGRRLGIRDFR